MNAKKYIHQHRKLTPIKTVPPKPIIKEEQNTSTALKQMLVKKNKNYLPPLQEDHK